MGGVDIANQRSGSYTVEVKTRRWTVKVFSCVHDVTRVNALDSFLSQQWQESVSEAFLFQVWLGWDPAMALLKLHMKG